MGFERNLKQTATYWAPTGETDKYGKNVFADPVQIPCRWENVNTSFQSKIGEETTSKSKVYVASALDVDGYLFLGIPTGTAPEIADPTKIADAWEIQGLGSQPDLRNMKRLTVAFL